MRAYASRVGKKLPLRTVPLSESAGFLKTLWSVAFRKWQWNAYRGCFRLKLQSDAVWHGCKPCDALHWLG